MEIDTQVRIGTHQLSFLKRCPHCAVAAPQTNCVYSPDPIQPNNGGPNPRWGAYRCTNCGGWMIVRGSTGENVANPRIVEIFPGVASAHEDLPEKVQKYLNQAMQTLAAPDASAVMSGSAVDAMLKELGYERGSVYDRIDQAVKDHLITTAMGEWAHVVRLGANRPRHADKDAPHVSEAEARQSLEFAEALGNFLFVLTAKIDRGIEAAQPN